MGILIQNTFSKFSKTKNQTQKRPPKITKNQKHIGLGLGLYIWFKMLTSLVRLCLYYKIKTKYYSSS